jgi:hypothetical protein
MPLPPSRAKKTLRGTNSDGFSARIRPYAADSSIVSDGAMDTSYVCLGMVLLSRASAAARSCLVWAIS